MQVTNQRLHLYIRKAMESSIGKTDTCMLWWVAVYYFFKKQLILFPELEQLYIQLLTKYPRNAIQLGVVQTLRHIVMKDKLITFLQCKQILVALKESGKKNDQPNPNVNKFFNEIADLHNKPPYPEQLTPTLTQAPAKPAANAPYADQKVLQDPLTPTLTLMQ